MKTPLSYYGGKQQLASKIVSLIPEHRIYCEPFIGGAAVFFAKPKSTTPTQNIGVVVLIRCLQSALIPFVTTQSVAVKRAEKRAEERRVLKPPHESKAEIINDINSEIVNFYEVLQRDFTALQSEIAISLHSRKLHRHAQVVYENPEMFGRIKRAWAVWILANMSFNNSMIASFTHDKKSKLTRSLSMKRRNFNEELAMRIQDIQIECCDALKIIRSRDSKETFFYLDPPYVGADQGHYDGYSQEDFNALITELSKIEGKFLLSSYRNKALTEAVKQNKWYQIELKINNHPGNKTSPSRTKVEVITTNYPIKIENNAVKLI